GSMMKYAAELDGMMPNVKDQSDNISKISIDSVTNVNAVFDIVNTQTETSETEDDIAAKIVDDTNSGIADGVDEGELIENIQDAKQEHQNKMDKNNELFDGAKTAIATNLSNANQAVDELITVVVKQSELEDNVKQELFDDAALIKAKIKNLEQEAIIVLSEAEKNYAAENAKIIEAYDNYAKAVDDYFAKKITKEEFDEAGNIFRQAVTSSSSVINKDNAENIAAKINEISEDIVNLKEKILNSIGNNKNYSDEDEPQKNSALDILSAQKFAFNYQESHIGIFLTGVYSDNDKRFLYSKEFECKGRSFSTVEKIEKHLKDFRDCVSAAKTEKEYWCQGDPYYPQDSGCNPYKESVYKGYEKDGVYKHLLEDYSIANIVNISRIKQYAAMWQDIEDEKNDKATLRVLKETLKNVDNTRNAFSLLGMIDIEAPRLWSELRRIDAVYRAKEAVKRYEGMETLYLDKRYDYVPAEEAGKLVEVDVGDKTEDKAVFPNMMLQHCEKQAEEMSLSPKEKYDKERIKQTEKNIADCMYKYALYAGRGGEGSLNQAGNEEVKKIWQRKQSQAMTDTSFDMLTLAVMNNIRSSDDYTSHSDETNIVTLQKGLKDATVARDDYAAGAEINYYSTQQLLTIVEADAQNLQAEIAKDLSTMDYSYFGQVQ
ncbi:MAG: hypothetical protein J6C85_04275, partial [Alphaproteobacteria bacterium]|nr:hypothetical protein [Alphaproteobacteria bacterium]